MQMPVEESNSEKLGWLIGLGSGQNFASTNWCNCSPATAIKGQYNEVSKYSNGTVP
jgi:hypothetical protein